MIAECDYLTSYHHTGLRLYYSEVQLRNKANRKAYHEFIEELAAPSRAPHPLRFSPQYRLERRSNRPAPPGED